MTSVPAALRELAEPWAGGEPVKAAINRAAKAAGLKYWRTFDLWYEKARRVEPFEIDQIETALAEKREREAQNEFRELTARLRRLEASLLSKDQDFYRPQITALRSLRGAAGGDDSSMD